MAEVRILWSDEDILAGIKVYRNAVDDKHGPPSLDTLGEVIAKVVGTDAGPVKSILSYRIRQLMEDGRLTGQRDDNGDLLTFTLDVVPEDGDGDA